MPFENADRALHIVPRGYPRLGGAHRRQDGFVPLDRSPVPQNDRPLLLRWFLHQARTAVRVDFVLRLARRLLGLAHDRDLVRYARFNQFAQLRHPSVDALRPAADPRQRAAQRPERAVRGLREAGPADVARAVPRPPGEHVAATECGGQPRRRRAEARRVGQGARAPEQALAARRQGRVQQQGGVRHHEHDGRRGGGRFGLARLGRVRLRRRERHGWSGGRDAARSRVSHAQACAAVPVAPVPVAMLRRLRARGHVSGRAGDDPIFVLLPHGHLHGRPAGAFRRLRSDCLSAGDGHVDLRHGHPRLAVLREPRLVVARRRPLHLGAHRAEHRQPQRGGPAVGRQQVQGLVRVFPLRGVLDALVDLGGFAH
mmetsp:Transcript_43309/g.130884  ORF Transcript_43309/g.130884 Transcript_43309/m.130884 type:complete len:370 (-) Transcript_43309:1235-2344(-)